jgi:formylmethanofuran dehydrogenase subunit E
MESFETLLKGSAEAHGHFCPGQVIGVRMAMLGCELIGLDDPRNPPQIKKIVVYVEIDRCATDAIAYVTGVKLGRRSLKFKDYGIMAATFVNLETKRAFRIVSTEESRDLVSKYALGIDYKSLQKIEAYKRMAADELFTVQEVEVEIPEGDMPGPSRFKVVCGKCGQVVRDNKQVLQDGLALCVPCAAGAYYELREEMKSLAESWLR